MVPHDIFKSPFILTILLSKGCVIFLSVTPPIPNLAIFTLYNRLLYENFVLFLGNPVFNFRFSNKNLIKIADFLLLYINSSESITILCLIQLMSVPVIL